MAKLIYMVLLAAALQSCSYASPNIGDNMLGKSNRQTTKSDSPRRAPNNNVSPTGDSNVQKSDPAFDAYQHYQAPNPPTKRRPALNMRELNETMDKEPPKSTAKKKAKILVVAQNKKEAAVKAIAIAKARDAELAAAKPKESAPKKKIVPVVNKPQVALETKASVQTKTAVQAKASPVSPAQPKTTTTSAPISTQTVVPKVTLPETNNVPSSTSQAIPKNTPSIDLRTATQADIEKAFEEKNTANTIEAVPAPVTPSVAPTANDASPASSAPSVQSVPSTAPSVVPAPSVATSPALPTNAPQPPLPALPQDLPMPTLPSAMSKATESSFVSRLNSLNDLFIECYFAVKGFVMSVFSF